MTSPTHHFKACPYLSQCSGCHFDHKTYVEQTAYKKNHLSDLLKNNQIKFNEIHFRTVAENGLRQRFDFTIDDGKMGLYDFDKKIVDITHCLQISDPLQKAYEELRQIKFPIKKGSVRLRVGPQGHKGVWLDFANVDIKKLLDEKTTFQALLSRGFQVEIGQKGKSLSLVNGFFKLTEPKPEPWFQTKIANNNYVTLRSLISSFTQPSWQSAFVMTDLVRDWISTFHKGPAAHIIEFGAGVGQFTIPLLFDGYTVDVFESHVQATEMLQLNANENELSKNLNLFCGDYQKNSLPGGTNYDFAFVNPPRSGLKNFADELIHLKMQYCIYVSCFPESLAEDLKKFTMNGYQIEEVVIVDQFPQTKHFETCVLLKRVDLNS